MDMQFGKNVYPCLRKALSQTQYQEQTQEVRLPEGMPDIGSILGAWGQCVLRGKQWNGDTISANGGVMGWILYVPADGSEPRNLEIWIPMQMKWDIPDCKREGYMSATWRLRGMDARMLSARKMMVRATVGAMAEALEPWDAEVYTPESLPEDVQLLRRSYPVTIPTEVGEKVFAMDEELSLPVTAEQILYCHVAPVLKEQQVVGGKAVFRGEGRVHLLCRDGEGQLHTADAVCDFSQFSDLDKEHDKEAAISTVMAVSSLEPELVEGRVHLKCGLVAQYTVLDRMMLDLVEDAYSPVREVAPQYRELDMPVVLDRVRENTTMEGATSLQPKRVVDVIGYEEFPILRRAGDLAEMELAGSYQVLYMDEAGSLQSCTIRGSGLWELPVGASAAISGNLLAADRPQITQSGDQLMLSSPVECELVATSREGMPMIVGFEMGEPKPLDPQRPSLILRRAGGESLWDLAKSSGSSVDAIRLANHLDTEEPDDRMLLIPVS